MEGPPQSLPPNENKDATFIAVITCLWLAGNFFVALRLYFRARSAVGFWWDDWFILFAVIISWADQMIGYTILRHFIGHHIYYVDKTQLPAYFRANYAISLLYPLQLAAVKFSILAFYWRLFSVTSRKPIYIVGSVVILFTVSILFAIIFQCKPIRGAWEPMLQDKKCFPYKSLLLGGSIPNIVTDAFVIALPIPYVINLKMRLSQRVAVIGVFGLGIFVTVASIARLVEFWRVNFETPDVTYALFSVSIWSAVETEVAIICACLPMMKPLLNFFRTGQLYPTGQTSETSRNMPSPREKRKKWPTPISSIWSRKATRTTDSDVEWDSLCVETGNSTRMDGWKPEPRVKEESRV